MCSGPRSLRLSVFLLEALAEREPRFEAVSIVLSISYITAAAQNRWQNNVFKGITLQLMASLRSSLSHLPSRVVGPLSSQHSGI